MSNSILTTPFKKSLDQPIFILFQPLDLIQPLFLTVLSHICLLDLQKALDLRPPSPSSFPSLLDQFTSPFTITLFSPYSTISPPLQSSSPPCSPSKSQELLDSNHRTRPSTCGSVPANSGSPKKCPTSGPHWRNSTSSIHSTSPTNHLTSCSSNQKSHSTSQSLLDQRFLLYSIQYALV